MTKRRFYYGVRTVGLAVSFGVFMAVSAHAISVTTTVNGTVALAVNNNPFGLMVGDPVMAVAEYNDSGIPATGAYILELDSHPAFSLTITLGNFTFQETDDDLFGSGSPKLQFFDGDLLGIDFNREQFSVGIFQELRIESSGTLILEDVIFKNQFIIDNVPEEIIVVEGPWSFPPTSIIPSAPIPEPSTWLLLGTGLIGLFGYKRFRD
ncbi:MAG: PEP-CTERM sorting domain-containing protein [Nitrospirales bacterium]